MSVLLDVSTELVSFADNAKWTVAPVTNPRSLVLWVKFSTLPTTDYAGADLLSINADTGNKLSFGFYENGGSYYLECDVFDSGWNYLGSFGGDFSVSINTWYHIVFIATSSGSCHIYVNEVEALDWHDSWDDTTSINPTAITIGMDSGSEVDFSIACIALFSKVLTAAEITMMRWNPGWCIGHTNLIHYSPVNEQSGSTVLDFSGTPTNGTITGATWADNPPVVFGGDTLYINYAAAAAPSIGGLILASRTLQSLTQGRVLG